MQERRPVYQRAGSHRRRAPQADAVAALEVLDGGDLDEVRRVEQCTHRRPLVEAVLQQQPSAGLEVRRRVGDEDPDRVQAVGTGRQRRGRLVAEVAARQVRVTEPT